MQSEKMEAFKRSLQRLDYFFDNELAEAALRKYQDMGGTFSFCGSTKSNMNLETEDDWLVDNIAYSLGMKIDFKKKT